MYGQERNFGITSGGNLVVSDGKMITYTQSTIDSATIGLIADWSSANENHADSLTFNSTGDLIIYVSNDTVVLDGATNVTIGNAVRFTTALSGTAYTITDTTGSADTLVLDQACTASLTDEFFTGCLGTLQDVSDSLNHAVQTTGLNQPKVLWLGTDSIQIFYDGLDFMDFTEIVNSTNWSIEFWLKRVNVDEIEFILANSATTAYSYIRLQPPLMRIEADVNSDVATGTITDDNLLHHYTIICNNNTISIYEDNAAIVMGDDAIENTLSIDRIASSTTSLWYNGVIDDIKIYIRILSTTEIQDHYETGRFYTP